MASRNDITLASIRTQGPSESYDSGWDRIFGKKKETVLTEIATSYERHPYCRKCPADPTKICDYCTWIG